MAAEAKKQAAIDADQLRQTPLSDLTADRFLEALTRERAVQYLPYWPEKKKYELYVEPENLGGIRLDRLLDILRGEKKKVEYEVPPWFDLPFRDRLYDNLVDRLARDIEKRLGGRAGDPSPQPSSLGSGYGGGQAWDGLPQPMPLDRLADAVADRLRERSAR